MQAEFKNTISYYSKQRNEDKDAKAGHKLGKHNQMYKLLKETLKTGRKKNPQFWEGSKSENSWKRRGLRFISFQTT